MIRLSKTHVMIDLETMGTGNDAAIIALGAVKFDPRGSGLLDAFYTRVDLGSSLEAGLSVNGSTIDWWMHKDRDQAREALLSSVGMPLWEVLTGFISWMESPIPKTAENAGFDGDPLAIEGVWGNGATFDNVILRTAYNKLKMQCPWTFRQDRCYRTLKALTTVPVVVGESIAHHALNDAVTQAHHMQAICAELEIDP